MKTITVTSVTVVGTDITIVGTIADTTFTQPAQQVSVPDYPSARKSWTRAARLTDAAAMVMRYGSSSVALLISSLAKIAYSVEPSLTWPIAIATAPTAQSCVHASTTATFSVVITANELASTYQWQECATLGGSYTNVANVGGVVSYTGGTTASLVVTPTTTGRNGYYYKCVITNANGNLTTTPVQLTVT